MNVGNKGPRVTDSRERGHMAKGVYTVRVANPTNSRTKKLIIH